ncbi:spnA [Symbiodinium necroappetens]|uniref:SpnA protein n=1 Tax=Symbiodinium necroappetens TaxID=1628268 RepID=A0A813BRP1_9DINO|nr:spnA [Symbiodinium necroappetens]
MDIGNLPEKLQEAEAAEGPSESESPAGGEVRRSFSDPRSQRSRTLTSTISPRLPGVPVRYGVHSIQNQRSEMEDAHRAVLGAACCSPSLRAQAERWLGNLSYFSVFDGHGGSRAAEFSSDRLFSLLVENRDELHAEPELALQKAFAQTEADWLTLARQEDLMDGTTAAVVVVDRMAGRCIVGNVGDSEVMLGGRSPDGSIYAQALTEVHHCKRSHSESQRIQDLGGRVWHGRLGHPKISPQVLSLSVSRAIGDLFFKDDKFTGGMASGLTADPYIRSAEVCQGRLRHEFLLIGCDGLWDTVSYEQAAALVLEKLGEGEEPQAISEALVRVAHDAGSMDNITVMVVAF